jgi:hypothetical protein
MSSKFEPMKSDFTSLNRSIYFGTGKGKRKIDEFQRLSDGPIFLINFFGSMLWDMVPAKDTKGSIHIEVSGSHHNGFGGWIFLGGCEPICEMLASNSLLDIGIYTERLYLENFQSSNN